MYKLEAFGLQYQHQVQGGEIMSHKKSKNKTAGENQTQQQKPENQTK